MFASGYERIACIRPSLQLRILKPRDNTKGQIQKQAENASGSQDFKEAKS